MGVKDQIHSTPEYQTLVQQQEENSAAAATATSTNAVTESVGPLIQLEKSDIEFWTQVAQLLVLILILVELRRRGGML